MVAGPPCSGKSFLARYLADRLGAPHLEMDRFRRRALPLSDQRVEHRDIAYRAMHLAAELLLPWCGTVVLDATYTALPCRMDVTAAAERVGAALVVVECQVEVDVAVKRFDRRGVHPAVDLTPHRVRALAGEYQYFAGAIAARGTLDLERQGPSLLRAVGAQALDAAARAAWCRRGRPREAAIRRTASAPAIEVRS